MRFYLLTVLIVILSFGFMMTTADAKRFGGGKSFGMSRSYSHSNTSYLSQPKAAINSTKSSFSRWLGPLAGFALGGLIASLFMGHGIGTGLLSWLAIGGILFFIWNLISKMKLNPTGFKTNSTYQTEPTAQFTNLSNNKTPPLTAVSNNHETSMSFDKEAFLRHAKTIFIRLQAAYDSKNLADIREFAAPVVFAEIQMQLQERGETANVTQVLNIDAELLELDPEADDMIASVIFSGKISEDPNKSPEAFKEIWHFRQDKISLEWIILGIQQMISS